MLIGNHDAVKYLGRVSALLPCIGSTASRRAFRAGTHAKLVADLQAVDLRQHLRHAGFRLEHHLKAVELKTAVVFGGDVGELDDFVMLGERARRAGVNRRSAARAGGKSDGAELHALAHHFFHGVEFFRVRFALIGGFAHDRQAEPGSGA